MRQLAELSSGSGIGSNSSWFVVGNRQVVLSKHSLPSRQVLLNWQFTLTACKTGPRVDLIVLLSGIMSQPFGIRGIRPKIHNRLQLPMAA